MSQHTHEHHIPLWVFVNVFLALIVLTGITVWVSTFDFGPLNLVIAMAVATVKATLVGLFFMHLYYDNKMYMFVFILGVLFVGVFITLTMYDTMRRGDLDDAKAGPIQTQAAFYDSLDIRAAKFGHGDGHGTTGEHGSTATTEHEDTTHAGTDAVPHDTTIDSTQPAGMDSTAGHSPEETPAEGH
ncbi:MAG: hypothetical protein D6675_01370 [Gemmatimonadetes bacterium]|nr:MAG: hypothetical protein D6675_01370 [Gemmatimonadota bacterium]